MIERKAGYEPIITVDGSAEKRDATKEQWDNWICIVRRLAVIKKTENLFLLRLNLISIFMFSSFHFISAWLRPSQIAERNNNAGERIRRKKDVPTMKLIWSKGKAAREYEIKLSLCENIPSLRFDSSWDAKATIVSLPNKWNYIAQRIRMLIFQSNFFTRNENSFPSVCFRQFPFTRRLFPAECKLYIQRAWTQVLSFARKSPSRSSFEMISSIECRSLKFILLASFTVNCCHEPE